MQRKHAGGLHEAYMIQNNMTDEAYIHSLAVEET